MKGSTCQGERGKAVETMDIKDPRYIEFIDVHDAVLEYYYHIGGAALFAIEEQ